MPPKKNLTDKERRAAAALKKKLYRQKKRSEQEKNEKIPDSGHKRRRNRTQKKKSGLQKDKSFEESQSTTEQAAELRRLKARQIYKTFCEARRQLLTVHPDQYEEKLREIPNLSENMKSRLLKSVDPQQIEDTVAKRRFQRIVMTEEQKMKERTKIYMWKQARLANMSKEELEQLQERNRQRQREHIKNLSGEKLEKYKASLRKAVSKQQQSEQFREKMKAKYEGEPPEKRQRRLQNQRINQAKRLLKKKLENAGASQEKIQSEVDKLVEKMKAEPLPPLDAVSSYKPRPRKQNSEKKSKPSLPQLEPCAPEFRPGPSFNRKMKGTTVLPPPVYFTLESHNDDNPALDNNVIPKNETFNSQQNTSELYDSPVPTPPSPELSDYHDDNDLAEEITPKMELSVPDFPDTTFPISITDNSTSEASTSLTSQQTGNWSCPICNESVPSAKLLSEHYKTLHGLLQGDSNEKQKPKRMPTKAKLSFICMKCTKVTSKSIFTAKDKLFNHVKQKHSKFYFPCSKCNLLKYRSTKLQIHLKVCLKSKIKLQK